MNIWERIRRFWARSPGPDHPLSEREREDQPPASAYDEVAHEAGEFLGGDPDADGADR
jgi:hypothetical protein